MIDTLAIKQVTDCRQLLQASLGEPARRSGRTWQWRCCFHDDRQPSLTAYFDGWKCYGCDARGDAISWLQEREGLSFREAVNRLSAGNLPAVISQPIAEPKPVTAEPPDEEWQTAAMAAVVDCQERLWSSEGVKARQWLNNRGLRDETLQRWLIGFNPEPRHFGDLYIDRGITIPHWQESANTLRALKIRRAVGDPKYTQVAGGKSGLYLADTLPGQRRAFVCEGEFDALLLWQEIGDLAAVCTFGSASAHSIDSWLPSLLPIERFYICGDNDEAGAQMWQYWQRTTKRATRAAIPAGKDITEYWQSGGDLRAWGQAVINETEIE